MINVRLTLVGTCYFQLVLKYLNFSNSALVLTKLRKAPAVLKIVINFLIKKEFLKFETIK